MNEKENLTDIQRHSAGATVEHKSPFERLTSHVNEIEITQTFRNEWVIPFYFKLHDQSDEWTTKMIALKSQINEDVILQNLGDFDWRTRSTGSYFAGIKMAVHLDKIIGTHLLKSEVCFAGSQYAKTLALFNTEYAVSCFNLYLDYYLTKPELYFDQDDVIYALKYLDGINQTNHIEKHLKNWENFVLRRNQKQIENLTNLKRMFPDNCQELDKQIQETQSGNIDIDLTSFNKSMSSLNRIAHG